MTTTTLEPTLTAYDKRILKAIPECGELQYRRRNPGETTTVWQLAEALNTYELSELLAILWGFQHLGYVEGTIPRCGERTRWWRTPAGDEAVEA